MNGIFSRSAVSYSSSNSRGCSVEPRLITGPEPSSCLPISFTSIPGASVAWVTSTTIAASGSQREGARARAPERDLLLRDRHRRELPLRAAGLGHEPRRLQRHERAQAVVERA